MDQHIFVSKPNGLNDNQKEFWEELKRELKNRNLKVRSIGDSDYSYTSPLKKVREVMRECHGAIILGLRQKYIREGNDRDENQITDEYLPTPWNELEAGMAFMLDLPMLIIVERGVAKEGIFNAESSDRFILESNLNQEWIESEQFLQPLNEWRQDVFNRGDG